MYRQKNLAAVVFLHKLGEQINEDVFCLIPHLFINTVVYFWSFHLTFDDTDALQLFKMLRDGGLRQGKLVNQIITDTSLITEQVFKNGHPCRMVESLGQVSHPVLTFFEKF